jgi:hypothetical protein
MRQNNALSDLLFKAGIFPYTSIFAFLMGCLIVAGEGYVAATTRPFAWANIVAVVSPSLFSESRSNVNHESSISVSPSSLFYMGSGKLSRRHSHPALFSEADRVANHKIDKTGTVLRNGLRNRKIEATNR